MAETEARNDWLTRDRDRVQAALDRLQDGIARRNLNRRAADLICPQCGAEGALHEPDEEHPGVFACRGCGRTIFA